MADIAELTRLIEPEAKALGLELVRVKMMGGSSDPTLQVMAERSDTRQLSLEDCACLSRRLSERLDEVDPIQGSYRLEVSSPGIDRPLTRLKDFEDWKGYEARISLAEKQDDRKQFKGIITGTRGRNVVLYLESGVEVEVAFSKIHSAKLIMTDKLIEATAPLSAEGADTIKVEEGQD